MSLSTKVDTTSSLHVLIVETVTVLKRPSAVEFFNDLFISAVKHSRDFTTLRRSVNIALGKKEVTGDVRSDLEEIRLATLKR